MAKTQLSAAALVLAGCAATGATDSTSYDAPGERDVVALADASAHAAVVDASWALGWEALSATPASAHAVVSPASLVAALAMLAESAVGDEATPFDAVLGASGDARTDAVNALQRALERYDGDPALVAADELPATPMVHTARQLVVDDQFTPAQAVLDRLKRGYGAGVLSTDLASGDGIRPLHDFARRETGGLIERSAIEPSPDLLAVLQDAIVLAAAWEQPFALGSTFDEDFVTRTGPVPVPTMSGIFDVPAVEQEGWQAVRLPYDSGLAADLLLPPAGSPAAADPRAADVATISGLSAALSGAPAGRVAVTLPKLDLRATVDLTPMLGRLGLAGDLTGLAADGTPVSLAQAVQQAVLQVDEEGTRAAAFTELAVAGSAPIEPPLTVRFDRPFVFVVTDTTTGWPLFVASILDPRA